jgi:hypothetical protein
MGILLDSGGQAAGTGMILTPNGRGADKPARRLRGNKHDRHLPATVAGVQMDDASGLETVQPGDPLHRISFAADDDAEAAWGANPNMVTSRARVRPARELWMAWAFALGSTCFLVGPLPGYATLVGATSDAITFFVGSILFTIGGALQSWLAAPARRADPAARAAWWAAVIQSIGTLFFNITTFRALQVTLTNPSYDKLVWRPDAYGSVCFLISGVIAYRASARRGWLPVHGGPGWWQPAVNLLGCVFFGIAAIAGYVVGSSSSMLDQAAANLNTAAGAACFLACAVGSAREQRQTTTVPA